MKDNLDIIVSVIAVIATIWRIASVKAEIYRDIDKIKDDLEDQNNQVDRKLQLHLAEYTEKKEFWNYRFHGLDELIKHKFNRCWGEIKEIQGYLNKTGNYQIRHHTRIDENSEDFNSR